MSTSGADTRCIMGKYSAGERYSHMIELQNNYKLLSEERRLKSTLEKQGELQEQTEKRRDIQICEGLAGDSSFTDQQEVEILLIYTSALSTFMLH